MVRGQGVGVHTAQPHASGALLSVRPRARSFLPPKKPHPESSNTMACYSVYDHGDSPVSSNDFLWHDKDFVRCQGRYNSLESSNDL